MNAFAHLAPRALAAVLAIACVGPGPSAAARAATIALQGAWTRPAAAGQNAAGYLTIVNHGGPDRLLGARSPAAASVTIHETRSVGQVMTMRPLASAPIAAGASLALAPGGVHLMLVGLKRPLVLGGHILVVLTFERAGAVRADLEVRSAAPAPVMPGMKM